jgi:hypothetical protein
MGEDRWEGALADGVLTYERQLERRVAWLEHKVMRLIYILNIGIGAVFGGLVFVLLGGRDEGWLPLLAGVGVWVLMASILGWSELRGAPGRIWMIEQ